MQAIIVANLDVLHPSDNDMFLLHFRQYQELTEAGVLQEIQVTKLEGHQDKEKGMKHYVTPNGVSSLVKHFIQKAGTHIWI